MATRRQIQTEDEEIQHLNAANPAAAVQAYRRAQAETAEREALGLFFTRHPEVANCDANAGLLLNEARTYGVPITGQLLEVAMLRVAPSLAAAPPTPVPEPTPEEAEASNRKRLLSMTLEQLHDEVRQRDLKKRIPNDSLFPEVAALKTKSDINRLSRDEMRRLLYRSDGTARILNTERINEILAGQI